MTPRTTRLRPWASGLAILTIFLTLYIVFQFLASSSLYRVSDTSAWEIWKKNDYHIYWQKPISSELENGKKIIEEALALRPTFRGFQNKTGILDPISWMPQFKDLRKNKTLDWALCQEKGSHDLCETTQPPLQYPGCLVHINHAYRFIWIKGKKVGGTTIREPLGWICGDHWKTPKNISMEFCSERWHFNTTTSLEEARQYWEDYFVFGFIRNPYSRYGSSYTYVNGKTGQKNQVPFREACGQPFLQAFIALNSSVSWFGHHVHHIMEQSSCLFTQEGLPAVDFVGETEFLHEDLKTVLIEINKRKSPSTPDLEMPDHLSTRNANSRENYAVSLYARHPECMEEVEKHFSIDFKRLGYEFMTKRKQVSEEEGQLGKRF